jgi:hypothetical protein
MCYPKLSITNLNSPNLTCHIIKHTNQNVTYINLNYLKPKGKSYKTKKTVYSIAAFPKLWSSGSALVVLLD